MIFTEAEKAIFEFTHPDGSTLYADPLSLRRGLIEASLGQFEDWLSKVKSGEDLVAIPDETARGMELANQMKIQGQMLKAARQAFGAQPIDIKTGNGFTDAWVLSTLQLFLDWIQEKKAE
jgi:hypothetical protein